MFTSSAIQVTSIIASLIGIILGPLGAFIAINAGKQAQQQSRLDEEHRKREYELHHRQTVAQEKTHDEMHAIMSELAENKDPEMRRELEAKLKSTIDQISTVTPDVLDIQLANIRSDLREELQKITSRIESVMSHGQAVENMAVMNRMLRESQEVNLETKTVKTAIEHLAEQGLNIEQLQRELLLNIGEELIQLSKRVASPTVRRFSTSGEALYPENNG